MKISKAYIQPTPTAMVFASMVMAVFNLLYILFILAPTYLLGAQNLSRFQIVTMPGLTLFQQFLWVALPAIAIPLFCILLLAAWIMRQDLSTKYLGLLMVLFTLTIAIFFVGWSSWASTSSWLFF